MTKSVLAICLFFLSTAFTFAEDHVANNEPGNKVNFFAGSFELAKAKAGSEGKLFFVEFYADWCTPCKWMDKTTFRDDDVVDQLNNNYVPLKLDIESTEGQEFKSQYEVKILPTILIFNSQGRMIERIEKTLSSESMMSLLTFHNNPENRIVVSHSVNKSPFKVGESTPSDPQLEHLYQQLQFAENFKSNYKLLVGNFFDYTEAHFKVREMQEKFDLPVVVMNQYVQNTTQYKVLLGEFKTIVEAQDFKKDLKENHGIEATVY